MASPVAVEMLRQTKPWVRLFSVLMFIGAAFIIVFGLFMMAGVLAGAASVNSGAAAVAGLFPILLFLAMGLLYLMPALFLGRYASRINDLVRMRRTIDLEAALTAQKSFWKFVGIVTTVVLILYFFIFVMMILMVGAAGMSVLR